MAPTGNKSTNMKNNFFFILLLFSVGLTAQNALYNSGNIRIHDTGKLGIHTNLINNSSFDLNLGLAGFYGNNATTVSGNFIPVFYDMEIFKTSSVTLETSIDVSNVLTFVEGDFITPRNAPLINLKFYADANAIGESNFSKVDGYVSIENKQNFFFPVGDSEALRPLILNSEAINTSAKCAYFYENPNNPSSFNISFNTTKKEREVEAVNTKEFWHLEGEVPSTISIAWNSRSQIALLTEALCRDNKTVKQFEVELDYKWFTVDYESIDFGIDISKWIHTESDEQQKVMIELLMEEENEIMEQLTETV